MINNHPNSSIFSSKPYYVHRFTIFSPFFSYSIHYSLIESSINYQPTTIPLLSHMIFWDSKNPCLARPNLLPRIPKPCRGCLDGGRSCGEWRNKRRNLTIKNGDTSNTGGCHGLSPISQCGFHQGNNFFPKKNDFFHHENHWTCGFNEKKTFKRQAWRFFNPPPQKKK